MSKKKEKEEEYFNIIANSENEKISSTLNRGRGKSNIQKGNDKKGSYKIGNEMDHENPKQINEIYTSNNDNYQNKQKNNLIFDSDSHKSYKIFDACD